MMCDGSIYKANDGVVPPGVCVAGSVSWVHGCMRAGRVRVAVGKIVTAVICVAISVVGGSYSAGNMASEAFRVCPRSGDCV